MTSTRKPNGSITIVVLMLNWCITFLMGIIITRACYRAMTTQDSSAYMRCILLNDQLERFRNVMVGEVASWAVAS